LILSYVACVKSKDSPSPITEPVTSLRVVSDQGIPGHERSLIVMRDDERRITCYVVPTNGISCVPDVSTVYTFDVQRPSPSPEASPSIEPQSPPPSP
jgi:hypothetical protein